MALGVVDLFEIGLVPNALDALLQGDHVSSQAITATTRYAAKSEASDAWDAETQKATEAAAASAPFFYRGEKLRRREEIAQLLRRDHRQVRDKFAEVGGACRVSASLTRNRQGL
jgi:hypothetical protein